LANTFFQSDTNSIDANPERVDRNSQLLSQGPAHFNLVALLFVVITNQVAISGSELMQTLVQAFELALFNASFGFCFFQSDWIRQRESRRCLIFQTSLRTLPIFAQHVQRDAVQV